MERKERKIKNIRTYYLANDDFELQEKIEDIAYRERVNVSAVVIDALKEYIIKHGSGNPVYTLDEFTDSFDMKSVPAVFKDRGIWDEFLQECNPTIRQEILWRVQTIETLAEKWRKYE